MSIEAEDVQSFERHYQILKYYYYELSSVLPASNKKNTIMGLWLLYLLSSNKVSEYHSELESLSNDDIQDPHI